MPSDLWFPALQSGVCTHLPVELSVEEQGILNRFQDLSRIAETNRSRFVTRWAFQLEGIADTEAAGLDTFLGAVNNGQSFLFVDPFGNLLAHSGDLTAAAWLGNAGLVMTPYTDPVIGASWLLTNSSADPLEVSQTISLPATYATCWSAYLKTVGGDRPSLAIRAGVQIANASPAGGGWSRVSVALRPSGNAESRTAAIVVPPRSQALLAQPMLENAFRPSAYAPSGAKNAVYANCQLAQSDFVWKVTAPGAQSISFVVEAVR